MRTAACAVMVMMASACASRPAWKPSDAMERSARMLRQLDSLEADLHQGAQETDNYSVLMDRRNHAEQVACKVTDEHVAEIHRLAVAQEEKIRERRQARHHTLASLTRTRPRRVASN
jgi:predicted transposase YbfD/YdcC